MNPDMSLEMATVPSGIITMRTCVWLFPGMNHDMYFQAMSAVGRVYTMWTLVFLYFGMHSDMSLKMVVGGRSVVAHETSV